MSAGVVEQLKKYLSEYGVRTPDELSDAIAKQKPLNIGIFRVELPISRVAVDKHTIIQR